MNECLSLRVVECVVCVVRDEKEREHVCLH